jgi:hypothetical protein
LAITADLFQEWNQDFVLTAGGDIQLAYDWDLTRQAIERFIFTSPQTALTDGTPVPADDLFSPTFGLGARLKIGQLYNQATINQIKQLLYQGILASPNVDQTKPPIITYTNPTPHSLIFTSVVFLLNGQQNTIQLSLP